MDKKIIEAICNRLKLDANEFIATLQDGEGKLKDDAPESVATLVFNALDTGKKQQHQRGVRETLDTARKFMKSKGFDLPKDVEPKEAWEQFDTWMEEQSQAGDGKKPAEMTAAELAKLPAVKALRAEWTADFKKEYEALEGQFNDFKKGEEAKSLQVLARELIPGLVTSKGGMLESPATGVTAEDRLNDFLETLPWNRMRVEGDGAKKKIVMLDENGEPLQNSVGKPVGFEETVLTKWGRSHGFVKQDPSKGSPSPKPGVNADGTAKMSFANAKELDDYVNNEPDRNKRIEAKKAFAEQVASEEGSGSDET